MHWTVEQDEILFTYGNRGVDYCRRKIHQEFGIYRSLGATQKRASRIGAPLFEYAICPVCGRAFKKLNRNTGICEVCNYEKLWRDQIAKENKIRSQVLQGGDTDGLTAAKRKYDAQRQKVARLRRDYGDIVDLSRKMSSCWSELEKRVLQVAAGSKKRNAR